MLTEIKNVRQEAGRGFRRWFESDGLELVVWFDAERVTGFQLCYDFGYGEHALTWRPNSGFAHATIDAGDSDPLKNETPILVPNGAVPWVALTRAFEERSLRLEPALRDLVGTTLRDAQSHGR